MTVGARASTGSEVNEVIRRDFQTGAAGAAINAHFTLAAKTAGPWDQLTEELAPVSCSLSSALHCGRAQTNIQE